MRPTTARLHGVLFLAAVVPFGAGCNAVLGIHPPDDQDWDGAIPGTGEPLEMTSSSSGGDGGGASPAPASDAASDGAVVVMVSSNPHAWADWPMPNPQAAGLPNTQNYDATTTPGVVLDKVTGLRWQQTAPDAQSTWSGAAAVCGALTLGGGTWRLPSRIELLSIIDYTRTRGPAIDAVAFPDAPAESFWSSSALAGDAQSAWLVDFGSVGTLSHTVLATQPHRVRCVQ